MILSPHLVIAGGGRLGNLFPGLAVAQRLGELCPQLELTFVGSGDASERHDALTACHNYLSVPAHALPRSPLESIRYLTDNTAGYWASRWLLGEKKASLLLGLGGPVSGVMARAAHSRGVPFVLLEQNARASRTARTLGRHAEAVCLAHADAQSGLPVESPLVVTGVPTRDEFSQIHSGALPATGNHEGGKQLLVLAGANGSRSDVLNRAVVAALARVRKNLDGWRIVHQAGRGQLQATELAYQAAGLDALVVSQLDEIATAYAASDLTICRAGASTLAELQAVGLPAIVVPDATVVDDHQAANAAACVSAGAAVMVAENGPEPVEVSLARQLGQLLPNDVRRARMSQSARAIARPDAASRVAELCAGLLGLVAERAAA